MSTKIILIFTLVAFVIYMIFSIGKDKPPYEIQSDENGILLIVDKDTARKYAKLFRDLTTEEVDRITNNNKDHNKLVILCHCEGIRTTHLSKNGRMRLEMLPDTADIASIAADPKVFAVISKNSAFNEAIKKQTPMIAPITDDFLGTQELLTSGEEKNLRPFRLGEKKEEAARAKLVQVLSQAFAKHNFHSN